MQNDSQLKMGLEKESGSSGPERGRPILALLIIVVLAGVVGWFWLARDPQSREQIIKTVDEVRSTISDPSGAVSSMVSGVGNLIDSTLNKKQGPTSPPPVGQTNGAALPGAPSPLVQALTPTGDMADSATTQATAPAGSTESLSDANATLPVSDMPGLSANATAMATATGNATLPANATVGAGILGAAPHSTPGSIPGSTPGSIEDMLLRGENPEGPLGNGATQRGALSPLGAPTPPDAGRDDDMVVRVAFIDDLAQWMVDNYQPARSQKGRGSLQVSMQAANLRYGAGMRGLYWIGDNLPKGRSEALQYVFTPSMLDALYRLYIDRFMEAMAEAGDKPEGRDKPLTPEQRRDMYSQYAKRFQGLSGALTSVASMPDLTGKVDAIRTASQEVVATNARYSELVFQQDQARESGATSAAERLAAEAQAAANVYKNSVVKRERLQDAFAKSVGANRTARMLDDDTLVYIGMWIDRRVRENSSKLDAAAQAASIFGDLAKRFQQAAGDDS